MPRDAGITDSAFPEFTFIPWGQVASEARAVDKFREDFEGCLPSELKLKFKGTTSPLWQIVTRQDGEVVAEIDDAEGVGRLRVLNSNWTPEVVSAIDRYKAKKPGG